MRLLEYGELNVAGLKQKYTKITLLLKKGDFSGAQVKKLSNTPYYRAKLDHTNRILFKFVKHNNERCLLILEVIREHAYEKSRFLQNHGTIKEEEFNLLTQEESEECLTHLNDSNDTVHFLNKILSFDDIQESIFTIKPPLIIVGAAGSGKTALTLEKLKQLPGQVLYVSQSPYLTESARNLYYSENYQNDAQEIEFFHYQEFLESLKIPQGKPLSFSSFETWAKKQPSKLVRDPNKLFEEFKGVLTGSLVSAACLSKDDYLALGIKQTIFDKTQRADVYQLFERYLHWLMQDGYYDLNMVSHDYLALTTPCFDFVVIDEVQDLTNIQIQLILSTLHNPTHFMMCGDANQIVHPNFFSWSKVKSLFYDASVKSPKNIIQILARNYRNALEVNELSNTLLKIKNMRFGSIDKESHYLMETCNLSSGTIQCLPIEGKFLTDLNSKTHRSSQVAVLVLEEEHKAVAKRYFNTPLVFSIREAKGLEYESVIIFNLIGCEQKRFHDIAFGVSEKELEQDMQYMRVKDKTDKTLEVYKFYINALYVACTRAIKNIFFVEATDKHPMLKLLNLNFKTNYQIKEQKSSLEEWQKEARKLELQGKHEQVEEINRSVLKLKSVPWEVLTTHKQMALQTKLALDFNAVNKKDKIVLVEYALVYNEMKALLQLAQFGIKAAKQANKSKEIIDEKYYSDYRLKTPRRIFNDVDRYGINHRNPFNQTPLMVCAKLQVHPLAKTLLNQGADPLLVDNYGKNAFFYLLNEAIDSTDMARSFSSMYSLLKPSNISCQFDNTMKKIDAHVMEFLMLQVMLVLLPKRKDGFFLKRIAFATNDFLNAFDSFPSTVLADFRKKRAYLSSILSKNEVSRQGPYNRQLFLRVATGYYLPHPELSIRIGDEWHNVYQLFGCESILERLPLSKPKPLIRDNKVEEVCV